MKRDTSARGGYIHKGRKMKRSKPKARRHHDETTRRYPKITRQIFTTARKSAMDTRHPAWVSRPKIAEGGGRKKGRHGTDNKNDQGENT